MHFHMSGLSQPLARVLGQSFGVKSLDGNLVAFTVIITPAMGLDCVGKLYCRYKNVFSEWYFTLLQHLCHFRYGLHARTDVNQVIKTRWAALNLLLCVRVRQVLFSHSIQVPLCSVVDLLTKLQSRLIRWLYQHLDCEENTLSHHLDRRITHSLSGYWRTLR